MKIWINGEEYTQCFERNKEFESYFNQHVVKKVRFKIQSGETVEINKDVIERYEERTLFKGIKDSIDMGLFIWQILVSTDENYTSIIKRDGITYLRKCESESAKFYDEHNVFKDLEENRVYDIFRESFIIINE